MERLYSITLLQRAIETLAVAVTPLIAGILLIGLLLALIQGAFQVEDAALALAVKLTIVLTLASSSGMMIFFVMRHLAHDWLSGMRSMIDRKWSP